MEPDVLNPGGTPIEPRALAIPRAREIAEALGGGALDFVRLVECRRRDGSSAAAEVIVIDVDVERPQIIVNDIRHVERIAIVCRSADDTYPEVLALRADFPVVPHLNFQRKNEAARNLCLYDQSWDVVRSRWTAPGCIERIRHWLAATAIGTLHRDDQPLEPLLFGTAYRLVIAADLVSSGDQQVAKLDVHFVRTGNRRGTFIARKPTAPRTKEDAPQFIASMFFADARQHGVIRHAPANLEELASFVKSGTFDLLASLRERLRQWKDDGCLDAALIMVIGFPLQRSAGKEAEISDVWAFLTMRSVFEVGKSLGVWDKIGKGPVGLLIPAAESCRGGDIEIDVLRPHFSFSRAGAAASNGLEPGLCKTVAVGAGALGSQVVMTLLRSGFGTWKIIDDDDFLPHNLARHALPPWWVGAPKAAGLAQMMDAYFEESSPTSGIVANVLLPGEEKTAVDEALVEADLILDLAASVPVARHLALNVESKARRMSLFLNPNGTDLVCLSEGQGRSIALDCLEMQYYRAVIRDERLAGHLAANANRVRYARSCRDISAVLPTHLIAIHAGIGAEAVRQASKSETATAKVWRCDPKSCTVASVAIDVHRAHRTKVGDWTLIVDEWLFQELAHLRSGKLPNETGGVLIGSYDLPNKSVYVVDTIPSPPDSEEWPTLYIRGSEGLRDNVAGITEMTAGQLEYVGEWHSHPDQCPCMPSDDDLKVFAWMTDRMSAAGLPAMMAIVGEQGASRWFVGQIERYGGWGYRNDDPEDVVPRIEG